MTSNSPRPNKKGLFSGCPFYKACIFAPDGCIRWNKTETVQFIIMAGLCRGSNIFFEYFED